MDKTLHCIKNICVILFIIANFKCSYGQDVTTFINSKKSNNNIDDRFISIVVDPAILMSRLSMSSQTLTMAKHFSPAFIRIRIQDFSTSQLSLADNVDKNSSAMKFTVTPVMWTSLNEWLISANLTPVFALSDRDRVNDAWSPKSVALPLMALADQMNNTCFWEIASDTAHKTLEQYANDVTVLRHILDAFPGSRKLWSVVGGELSSCAPPSAPGAAEGAEIVRKLLGKIEANVDAVDWTPNSSSVINFPAKIIKANPSITKRNPSVWTTAPRSINPTSFKDALVWAKYLGQAASNGYNVIFRQLNVKEFFNLTPVFWVSKFHKMLMGNNVLDVRSIHYNDKKKCHVFAHCTKNKNYLKHTGSATIFVVNLEETEINITTKFLGISLNNNEIYNYILTSKDENSSEIYLNGDLLTISDLQYRKIELIPKPRRAKPGKSIGLNLPAKSIGFFVIPISCPSACIHSEEHLHPIHPMSSEQNENCSIESEIDTTPASKNLHEIMSNEEDSNEKYYKNSEFLQETRDRNILALERQDESDGEMNKSNKSVDKLDESAISFVDDITNLIIERVKQRRKKVLETEQKAADLKQLLTAPSVSSHQMTNMKQGSAETKLIFENSQMEGENQIEQSENIDIRKKRELVSFEIPNLEMETQARKTRRTSEEVLNITPLSLDPLSEYSCDCKRRGIPCNCGLKLVNNIIQKLWNNEPEIVNEKILNAVNLLKPPIVLTKIERIAEKNENPSNDLQDIKMLLQQYHTEMKTMLSSLKEIDEKANEINKFTEIPVENTIPKYRMKRKLSADLFNENSRSKLLRQNKNGAKTKWSRIKRQPTKLQNNNEVNGKKDEVENPAIPNPILPACIREEFLKRHMEYRKHFDEQVNSFRNKHSDSVIAQSMRAARSIDIRNNKIISASELNIQKRDILGSSSSSVEDTSDDNRTTKFNKNKFDNINKKILLDSDGDRTKETDTFLNEISKEGKNLPNYLKHIQEDIYLIKPDINNEKRTNILFKNNDEVSQEQNDDNDVTSKNKLTESKSISTTELYQNKIMNLPGPEDEDDSSSSSSVSSEEFVDALDTEVPSSQEDSNKEGLVDNVFHTMFDVLNDFHKKILEYLHYLSR